MISEKKSVFKRISVIIITAIVLLSVISMAATKIVYDRIFARFEGQSAQTPQALVPMVQSRQRQEYNSGKNRLTGYLYRCSSEHAQDGLIVLVPGFHAGADSYLWQIQSLLLNGWSVFAFDATGSFCSEGDSQLGFSQILLDLEATLEHIEKNGRFGYNDLVLFGHSKGAYAACCALGDRDDVAAVIAVSGVNSAMEGIMSLATDYVGPVAYGNYGFLWMYQAMLFGADTLNKRAETEISNSDVPVLVIHGAMDDQIPIDRFSIMSHSDQIRSDAVEYMICSVPDQNGHTNLLFDPDGTANDVLMEKIHDFLIRNIA